MPVGVETLARTVGAAMARAHGRPDLEWAVIPTSVARASASASRHTREEMVEYAKILAPQVEGILTGKRKGLTSEV